MMMIIVLSLAVVLVVEYLAVKAFIKRLVFVINDYNAFKRQIGKPVFYFKGIPVYVCRSWMRLNNRYGACTVWLGKPMIIVDRMWADEFMGAILYHEYGHVQNHDVQRRLLKLCFRGTVSILQFMEYRLHLKFAYHIWSKLVVNSCDINEEFTADACAIEHGWGKQLLDFFDVMQRETRHNDTILLARREMVWQAIGKEVIS